MLPRTLEQYYKPDGTMSNPTIKPMSGFSANADAERLHKAIRYLGTDEEAIIEILGKRTSYERGEVAKAYEKMFEKPLYKDIAGDTSFDFKKLCCLSLRSPCQLMAMSLYEAMRGVGTRERVLIEILCGCTNEEVAEVSREYVNVLKEKGSKDTSRTLRGDISSETSGSFRKLLQLILDGNQDQIPEIQLKKLKDTGISSIVNEELAMADAKDLYDEGEGRIGTNENHIMRTIYNRTKFQLKLTAECYEKQYGKSLIQAIESECSGDFQKALIWIIQSALNSDEFHAKRIHNCMAGPGTRDKALMRFILLHAEVDLEDIMVAYQRLYEKPLAEDIKGDTSGDYCKMLLTLCGIDAFKK